MKKITLAFLLLIFSLPSVFAQFGETVTVSFANADYIDDSGNQQFIEYDGVYVSDFFGAWIRDVPFLNGEFHTIEKQDGNSWVMYSSTPGNKVTYRCCSTSDNPPQ